MAKYKELSKKEDFVTELEARNKARTAAGLEALEFDKDTVNDDLVALLDQDDEERPEATQNSQGSQNSTGGKSKAAKQYYFLKTRAYVSDRERWDRGLYSVDGELKRLEGADPRSVEKLGSNVGQAKLHEIAKAMGFSVHNGAEFRPDEELMHAVLTEKKLADINSEPIKPVRDLR